MTKADILKVLERVPMNASVVFVAPPAESIWTTDVESEHEIKAAFTVTGLRGLAVVLTDGMVPASYDDVESVS
jgi:hypothetical protein